MNIARYTFNTIRLRPWHYLYTLTGSLLYFIIPLIGALIVREIFSNLQGIPTTNIDVWTLIFLFAFIKVFQLIVDVTWAIVMMFFFYANQILFRKNMLVGIFKQPGAQPILEGTGESMSRFRRDVEEASFFAIGLADLFAFIIFGIMALMLMLSINVEVTLFVFVPFSGVVILMSFFRRKITELRKERRKATGVVTSVIKEIFGSISTIKVTSSEENVLRHFTEVNDKRGDAVLKDEIYSAFLTSIRVLLLFSATAVMLLIITEPMKNNEFTIGDFALFLYLLEWVSGLIGFLGDAIAMFYRVKVSYDRMIDLMQGPEKLIVEKEIATLGPIYVKEEFPSIPSLDRSIVQALQTLEVENLEFRFPDSSTGIADINFKLKRGTLTVITGRVGSGKTTLIRVLLGLLTKNGGKITWNSNEVFDPKTFFIPPRIAYTAQVPHLFSDSVLSNLLLGLPEESVEISNALQLAVLNDDIKDFENGLNTIIGPKGVKLSGGQRQRLAAARMFLREPELLIFDDLSSALDVETEEILWNQLFATSSDRTYLVVSHRPAVLERADQILILKNGRIDAKGKLTALLSSCEEMKRLWNGVQEN